MDKFQTLIVKYVADHIIEVRLNRPDKRNAINNLLNQELRTCFEEVIPNESNCRVVLLTASGKVFSAGTDLSEFGQFQEQAQELDTARKAFLLRRRILQGQESYNSIEKCPQPVIAAVHSGCIGAGIDMICACDIRICSKDAWFSIKEVDVGICADFGTLQRLPHLIGNQSFLRELVYTADKIEATDALNFGFVSKVTPGGQQEVFLHALQMAKKNRREKSYCCFWFKN